MDDYNAHQLSSITGVPRRTISSWMSKGIVPGSGEISDGIKAIIAHYKQQADEGRKQRDALTEPKTRLYTAQAEKIELETATKRGELIAYSDAVQTYANLISVAKNRLLLIPDILRIRLNSDDAAEIDRLIREALDELSRGNEF